ncbi:MAG: hypothetical protein ACTH0V_00330 [Microbacteriaceae bacterium]
MNVSNHAAAAREQHRHRDGQFGRQQHLPPEGPLHVPERLTDSEAALALHLEQAEPGSQRAEYELAPHPFNQDAVILIPHRVELADGTSLEGTWSSRLNDTLPADWATGMRSPMEREVAERFSHEARPERLVLERDGTGWAARYEGRRA